MGQCNLLIDRHVHKNGGTTLRHIFQSMPSQCRYYGGWRGLVHKTWLQILNDTVGDASGQARWACIEAHYPLMEDLLPQIRLARHMASCRAVLILRYRDPTEMYFSFFKWDVAGRQRQRQVRVCHFTGKTREQATADGPCRPGDNFTQWVPNNLQTNILIDAERHTLAKQAALPRGDHQYTPLSWHVWQRVPPPERLSVTHAFPPRLSTEEWSLVDAYLSAADVVAPTERFREAMRLVERFTGLRLSEAARSRWVVPKHRGVSHRKLADTDVCPDLRPCHEAVRLRSSDDLVYHRKATARYESIAKAQLAGRRDGGRRDLYPQQPRREWV